MSPLTLVRDEERDVLTDRQREILDFISHSIAARGYPPTLREIGTHFGIRSTNGVNDHLRALEKKGYLQREDLKSRALRPVTSTGKPVEASSEVVDVPLLGRVAAGVPLLAVENVNETVRVDRFFIGQTREVFALRVKGDSMIEGEATVKRYYPEGDVIRFQPANASMQPIFVRKRDFKSVNLLGIVIGVYRKM